MSRALGIEGEGFYPLIDDCPTERIDTPLGHVVSTDLPLYPIDSPRLDHGMCFLGLEVHCASKSSCAVLEGGSSLLDLHLLNELCLELWAG